MTKDEVFKKIVGKGWFENVSEDEVAALVELSKIRRFNIGDFIYMVGDSQDSLFCILDGQVNISIIEPSGEEFGLTIWEEGVWFGEASLHEDGIMPLEARAKTTTEILVVPLSAIDSVLKNGAAFYRNIVIELIGRAKLLYKLVEILLFRPLRSRVAMRVLFLLEHVGEPQENGDVVMTVKFSQSDFAKMSGGSRQRVNQIFREWADKGVMSKQNKRYVVHNVDALQAELEAMEE